MQRVSVVGVSGAGKTTLARALAAQLGAPHVELDSIFHQPGWTPLAEAEFAARVEAATGMDSWVVDGNYSSVLPVVWQRADTVVWLDLPRRTTMRQLVWRTLRRAAFRAELWNGNREPLRNFFSLDEQQSVLVWAWRNYPLYRERYQAATRDPALAHLTFIRLASPRQARRLTRGPAPRRSRAR